MCNLLLVLIATLLVSGCGLLYRQPVFQGNLLDKAAVDQLQAGMDRQQVMVLLGTPSIRDPFHHDRWDYVASQRIGGLKAITVPYFPADKMLITRLDNLSLYYQTGARRRTILDNARRDRIENYESSNDAYVVEDLGCAALVENITIV